MDRTSRLVLSSCSTVATNLGSSCSIASRFSRIFSSALPVSRKYTATASITINGIARGITNPQGIARRPIAKAFTRACAVKVSGVIFIPADFRVLSSRVRLYLSIGISCPSLAAMPSIMASIVFESFLSSLPVFITAFEVLRYGILRAFASSRKSPAANVTPNIISKIIIFTSLSLVFNRLCQLNYNSRCNEYSHSGYCENYLTGDRVHKAVVPVLVEHI